MGILFSSGAQKTAYEIQQNSNLEGKFAIVTGASSGIGLETARQLAQGGARVVVTSPKLQRAEQCKQEICNSARVIKAEKIMAMELELASLRSVRQFAEDIKSLNIHIDYLILNAAIMGCPLWRTREGFEMHLGVNYIGHVHLTQLLLESMLKQDLPSRIIVTTCRSGLEGNSLHLGDMNFQSRLYDAGVAYQQSKLALSYFAFELATRLQGTKITVFLIHPGIVPTSLSRYYGPLSLLYAGLAAGWTKTVQQAAATGLYACTARNLEKKSGSYLQDCGLARTPGRSAGNPALWHRVWEMTQDWIDAAEIDSNKTSLNPAIQIRDVFWTRYIDPTLHWLGWSRQAEDVSSKQE